MFYRRKVILALIQLFDFELEKLRLQKLLFLFCQYQAKPEYDFIPYKFGCYSYSANADLKAMVTREMLSESETSFQCIDKTDYLSQLKESDKTNLLKIVNLYGGLKRNDLIKHTYIHYPYWATNSTMAENILSSAELDKVNEARTVKSNKTLYTIGYEGISLEEYLNRLIRNDVKVLVDVRCNPLSMKYGFNKNQLLKSCSSIGIEYIHIPDVGIQSDQRRELNTQADYDTLFVEYRKTNLTNSKSSQQRILDLLNEKKRIALTCFEANICQCHRKDLSEAIKVLSENKIEIHHI